MPLWKRNKPTATERLKIIDRMPIMMRTPPRIMVANVRTVPSKNINPPNVRKMLTRVNPTKQATGMLQRTTVKIPNNVRNGCCAAKILKRSRRLFKSKFSTRSW